MEKPTPDGVGLFHSVSHIDSWIHKVDILGIQLFPKKLAGFPKSLEVYDLTLPEELDHIVYIRVIGETQNIVVGHPGFLFWYVELFTTIISSLFENK